MQTRRATGIVLAAVAALVLAACEPAPPPWTGDSPSGSVDTVTFSGTSVKVQGWAGDRNTSDSIRVVFFVDGTLQSGATVANGPRPDVARATGRGGASGYSRTLTVPGASTATKVCVVALNVGPGDNSVLGCRTARATGSAPTTTSTTTTTTTTTTSTTIPASTVDQENFDAVGVTSGLSCPNDLTKAQTFTAGRTGTLDKVSLSVAGSPVAIDVEIVTVDGSQAPTANVIGSGSYSGAGDGEIAVTMTTPAEVETGTAYAIVMSTSTVCSNSFSLYGTNNNAYAGGSFWSTTFGAPSTFSNYTVYDYRFRTWVR